MKNALATTAFLTAVGFVGSTNAAVIDNTIITDLVGQSGNYTVVRDLGVNISGDSAVYLIGTMTIDDITALNSAYTEADLGFEGIYNAGFGNAYGNSNIVITRNGTRATADTTTFASGVSLQLLIKFDQTTGAAKLWLNPNLGTTEALNTPEAAVTVAEVNGADFDSVVFRGGDYAAPDRSVDYTDFAVYYGGDSPFAPVPEPTSFVLLGLGGLLAARRRR